jgi:hypothetical protein
MFVLRLGIDRVSFQHHSCIADHGPDIQVVTLSDFYMPLMVTTKPG